MTQTLRRCALLLALSFSPLLHAQDNIEFWHSSTAWAGQGQCAAEFTFDIGTMAEAVSDIQVSIAILDRSNRRVGKGQLKIDSLGGSAVDSRASTLIESPALCEDNLSIVVEKASAREGNKRVDLLKTQRLAVRPFRSIPIRIGK